MRATLFIYSIKALPGVLLAASLLGMVPVRSETPGHLEYYCAYTQSDDCIFVDSNGYWWDSEPSLRPVYKKMKKLPIKIVEKTKVVQLGNRFFCTKTNMQTRRSYLECSSNGWVFIN